MTPPGACALSPCSPRVQPTGALVVSPLGCVTVRLAAKDLQAAEAIAVGMAETEPSSAAAGASDYSAQPYRLPPPKRPPGPTRQAMRVICPVWTVGARYRLRETAVIQTRLDATT